MNRNGKSLIPNFIDLAAQRERLGDRIERAIASVLQHGQFVLGPEVAELERQLADFCGAKHVVSCANGTDALLLVLMAEGIGPGDAVFVPAFTFVATAEVVVLVGATPLFVDVQRDSFNLDPDSLEAAIAEAESVGLKARCVIPVDLYGQPADYTAIRRIADDNNLLVLADAAQSFGASLNGKVGTLANYTATSFYPSKPLGCYGDGGAIFTDDSAKAKLLVAIRCHGRYSDGSECGQVGLNSRLDTFQAAILLEKLAVFPQEIVAREKTANRYTEGLAAVVQTPRLMEGASSVWAQYTVVTERRDELAKACRAAKVPTAIHYASPLHALPAYREFPTAPGGLPNAEWLAERVISLPMHGYLADETQDLVIRTVRAALRPPKLSGAHAGLAGAPPAAE
jgi:UDP-2-acetamido-2-deoxy-ribo-hexuluronate aminotransferase